MTQVPKLPKSLAWPKAGALVGLFISLIFLGPELLHRLVHVAQGGRGESANWGEPLFYLVLLAPPLSALGYLIGRVVARVCASARDFPGK